MMMSCEATTTTAGMKQRPRAVVPVYRHQLPILQDRSRLIAWLKSRQIGGSFTATLKLILDAAATGEDWNTMSRTQRQAERLLLKAAKHALAINQYVVHVLRRPPIVDASRIGSQRIVLNNGATINAVPCDPDTTVGDTVNWLLDEFHLFPKSERIFGVIKPSIRMGKKMVVLSTPRGRRGKFFEMWEQFQRMGPACGWSWHKTTIDDAFAAGMPSMDNLGNPQSLEQFREQEIRDIGQEMYGQEYMCVFSDKLTAFVTWALVTRCQVPGIPTVVPVEVLAGIGRDLFIGVDVGRRHDLTVIWVVSRSGDSFRTEAVFSLEDTPFEEQKRLLAAILRTRRVVGCCIDEQGIGMQLAEEMKQEFPGVVEGVSFTNAWKAEAAYRVKVAMESENLWLPVDEEIRDDFASIERDITEEGRVKLSAPRNSCGHGDRFWACCLALHAAVTHRPFELIIAV